MNKIDRAKSLIESLIHEKPRLSERKFKSWAFTALEVVYKLSYTFNVSDDVLKKAGEFRDKMNPQNVNLMEKDLVKLLEDAKRSLNEKED